MTLYTFMSSTAAPSIEDPPVDQIVIVTLSTEFSCTAFGVPAPSVAWYLDDTQLVNDSVYQITSEVDGYYVTSYLMLVADLDYDGTIFTCFAENTVGSASADASLTVQGEYTSLVQSESPKLWPLTIIPYSASYV